MNDFDRLKQLLDDFGIPYTEATNVIRIEVQHNRQKIIGYNGFFTEFQFHPNKSFEVVGIWE